MTLYFDVKLNIVYITPKEKLTFENILLLIEEISKSPSYRPGMFRLWDLRDFGLAKITSGMLRCINLHSSQTLQSTKGKIAFVTANDLDYGLCRIFEGVSEDNTEVEVFRNMEKAQSWLINI